MLIVWIVTCRKIHLHTSRAWERCSIQKQVMICSYLVAPCNLGAQSEIQLFLKIIRFLRSFLQRGHKSQSFRTFHGIKSHSLIAGCLESATQLDKRGEGCAKGIFDGVVAASSIFVYNVVTYHLNAYLTSYDYVMNIIIKVMYFLQCVLHAYTKVWYSPFLSTMYSSWYWECLTFVLQFTVWYCDF